jgi:hypothetical protein
MADYILAYHSNGNMPASPEEGATHMERYKAWIEGMGDAVVNPGTPLSQAKTVSADGVEDGGGPNPVMGFTVIRADSLEAAIEMAQASPFLEMGTIELAEMMSM